MWIKFGALVHDGDAPEAAPPPQAKLASGKTLLRQNFALLCKSYIRTNNATSRTVARLAEFRRYVSFAPHRGRNLMVALRRHAAHGLNPKSARKFLQPQQVPAGNMLLA